MTPNLYATTESILRSGLSSRIRLAPSGQPHAQYTLPVQWPLAPNPVLLSGSILAYYGHIRASGAPLRFMYYAVRFGCPSPSGSPIYSASLSHRAIPSAPTDPTAAFDLVLRRRSCLRPLCRGSASVLTTHVEFTWLRNEVVSGSLSLRPDGLLALPRPGRLLSSFHPLGRPNECRV